ncbi:hypothetical protein [Amycolatopsis sp. NPDC098790]|uniref:hypothetical protein n=1 Tax=Amycolatopsis sp. NPDC098790 TaxID=3363939 RepID=UPI0038007890
MSRSRSAAEPLPTLLTGSAWRADLAALRELEAIESRDPAALIGVLTRAAECAEHDDELPLAETGWVRVLSLERSRKNHAGVCRALTRLSDLYRRWDRLHRAMDVLSTLIDTCDRVGDDHGGLLARRDMAEVLLDAGRAAAAVPHLRRAITLTDDDAIKDVARADMLILLGRAYWMSSRIRAGRKAFAAALALVDARDTHRAGFVRALLATPADGSPARAARDATERHGRPPQPPHDGCSCRLPRQATERQPPETASHRGATEPPEATP